MKLPVKIYLCRSGRVWIVDMQRFTCPNTIWSEQQQEHSCSSQTFKK
jgi:hypothetical protein